MRLPRACRLRLHLAVRLSLSAANENLKTFLGRDEIVFEAKEEGYLIKRNGEIAIHLSESEETAIALVYFIVHLQDRDFDIKTGIVVIDDPISSLDANSLFQAFAFIKDAIKHAYQFVSDLGTTSFKAFSNL